MAMNSRRAASPIHFAHFADRWTRALSVAMPVFAYICRYNFDSERKPIAAICHGVQLLAAAGVIAGRQCTGYPACGPEVAAAGGKWTEVQIDQAHVEGNLVTAPAWPAHPAWLAKFLVVMAAAVGTESVEAAGVR